MKKQSGKKRISKNKIQHSSLSAMENLMRKNAAMENLVKSNPAIERMTRAMEKFETSSKFLNKTNKVFQNARNYDKLIDTIQKSNSSVIFIHKQLEEYNRLYPKFYKVINPIEKHFEMFSRLERLNRKIQENPLVNFISTLTLNPDEREAIESIESNLNENLPQLLEKNNLLDLWNGANYALSASLENNPDKARHAIISLRALIEYILKSLLPPKEEIKNWEKYDELIVEYKIQNFENGIPRRIQLMYYCDKIDFGFINEFTINEIKHINDVFTNLSVIHKKELKLADNKLKYIKVKAGTVAWLLLMIHDLLKENELDNR